MNCAHCGTSLSTIDYVEEGHSRSEEHCTACAASSDGFLLDLVEIPLLAVGKRSSVYFGQDPLSLDFPLQVEMPDRYYAWFAGEPGGPVYDPIPRALRPVWQSSTCAVPFLTSPALPKTVILSNVLFSKTAPHRTGLLGFWGTWSPLTKCALFIVPVVVAAGTHFVVGNTSAAPVTEEPPASKILIEDFKSGLNQWQGAEGRAKPWKWESSEGATPQSLAVFLPALGIPDYKLEFTADAMKNSVSWATRIKDLQNYQAFQISLRRSGGESQLSFSRYKVAAGREGPRTQVPLQIVPPTGNVWRVKLMSVRDSRTLWINDQIANSWTDADEETGGIGFFAGNADQFVLKSVKFAEELNQFQ
jgi:hypothetical protein